MKDTEQENLPLKSDKNIKKEKPSAVRLEEGKDYYIENGMWVFTSHFLLNRGYCCNSGCRHCPYPKDTSK